MCAQYIMDENESMWFIGASDIVTQKLPLCVPPRSVPDRHVPVNPTLQARTSGKLGEAACMGDYCHLCLTPDNPFASGGAGSMAGSRRTRRQAELEAAAGPPQLGGTPGDTLGDLVRQRDGTYRTLAELSKPRHARKRDLLPSIKFDVDGDGEEDELPMDEDDEVRLQWEERQVVKGQSLKEERVVVGCRCAGERVRRQAIAHPNCRQRSSPCPLKRLCACAYVCARAGVNHTCKRRRSGCSTVDSAHAITPHSVSRHSARSHTARTRRWRGRHRAPGGAATIRSQDTSAP